MTISDQEVLKALEPVETQLDAKDPEKAASELDRLDVRFSSHALGQLALVKILALGGNYAEASSLAHARAETNPSYPQFWAWAVRCYNKLGNTDKADDCLMELSRCDSNDPFQAYERTLQLAILGERDRAESMVKYTIVLDQNYRSLFLVNSLTKDFSVLSS